jgi:protein-arginine deiminase
MRVAPIIFTADTQPAKRLFLMRLPTGQANNAAMLATIDATLPAGVEVYDVDGDTYAEDRWVQDNMQLGYQMMPGADGPRVQRHDLQTQRPTGRWGLEWFLPDELLDRDLGYTFPGGRETSLNYGGNIEVAPPHAGYPFGRMVVGGGALGTLAGRSYEDHMAREQRTFIDAQEIQGPALELSTEWLVVGHVDEMYMAVPMRNAAAGERPWKMVIALACQRWMSTSMRHASFEMLPRTPPKVPSPFE